MRKGEKKKNIQKSIRMKDGKTRKKRWRKGHMENERVESQGEEEKRIRKM